MSSIVPALVVDMSSIVSALVVDMSSIVPALVVDMSFISALIQCIQIKGLVHSQPHHPLSDIPFTIFWRGIILLG